MIGHPCAWVAWWNEEGDFLSHYLLMKRIITKLLKKQLRYQDRVNEFLVQAGMHAVELHVLYCFFFPDK